MSTTPFLEETARRQAEVRRGMFLAGLPRTLTAEEANIEFDFDTPLEEGWGLKLTRDETAEEGFGYSFIDPEGWEIFPDDTRISPTGEKYTNIVFDEAGEVIDYTVTTPEGETFTLAELTVVPAEPLPPAEPVVPLEVEPILTEDYALIYANYQRTGGTLGIEDWIRAGTPLIPELEVSAESDELRINKIVTDVFPDKTAEEFVNYLETDFASFVEDMRVGGYTDEKAELLAELGYSPEEIDSFYEVLEPALQALPPEGIVYTVKDEQGNDVELHMLEDFEYVGTERRLRSKDYIVFHKGTEVGRIAFGSGEFVATEPTFLQRVGFIAIRTLQYALYPFTLSGMGWNRISRLIGGEMPTPKESEEWLRGEWLPGGTEYQKYMELPFWQRLGLEAPAWVALGVLGITAIKARAALAPLAARPGLPGLAPTIARAALYPVAGYEQAVGLALKYTIGVPLKITLTGVSKATNAAFDKGLSGRLGYWLALQGSRGEHANRIVAFFLRQNRAWLQRKAQEAIIKRTAQGVTAQQATNMAAADVMNDAIPLLLEAAKSVTGKELVPVVSGSLVPSVALAIQGASPAVISAFAGLTDKVITGEITLAQITPEYIRSQIVTGLEKTPSLIAQLEEMGHTLEAISVMSNEEAWANLFKVPVAEVAPSAVPPAVPAVLEAVKPPVVPPEVPALPEVTPEIMGIQTNIQKAIEEHSYRLEHGWKGKTTGFTGFWITKQGAIYQHNKLRDIPSAEREGLINVHSHSPSGWQQRLSEGKLDDFDPLNAGDVENLQNSVKNGWSDTMAVIMGDGRMEVLRVPDNAKATFLRLTKAQIRKDLQLSYEQRVAIGKETGLPDYEINRNALRQFAERYGLEYETGISWKEVIKPPAVEVAKPPIEHRGIEPEGIAIADELGLRYDGIQEEIGMQFTDVAETGTTFYARTVEEARTTLADRRTAFAKPSVEVVAVEKPSSLTIETTKEDTFVETSVGEDASRTTQDAIEAQSDAANVPPPIIPPGTVGHIEAGGRNPDNAVYDMTNRVIPGEDAGRAAVRLWSGTRKRMATETISWWKKGSQVLRDKGIGKADGDIQRVTKEESYELFKALHGEADVPAELQDVYDELKALIDIESSDMLAFDPGFSRVMMAHPDYFPRGWRPPTAEQAGRMRIGVKPGFLKPRIDATFTEMVESGWEPISWNPYDMAALRRMAGTEYREGRILISRLKTFSKAIVARDAPIKGWRVPQVGPAFQGKPYVGGDGKAYMTPRMAVPNNVADVLESVYGVPVEFRVAGVNIFKAITFFGSLTKRVKLFGSLFQHVDFLTRDLITAFTPMGIRHALPLKFPALAARVTASAVSPSWRATLEARILSGEALYSDSTITLKMVADAGWELGQDELLIRREVRDQLESIIKETPGWEELRRAVRRLKAIPEFFEAGLFDGVYRESQAYALEHVIIPRLRQLHPDWTDEQIAGSAAEEVNKQFSTLAVWQSVLQQPAVREFARAIFFSFNESESWIRQATSAVKGKNARYWREYALATFAALAIAANAINLISEGKPLPLNRYVPISLGNSYSSMPWGIAYNSSFLSPRLPWNGRNGQPIYLDIVGQADTYLRWMLDPVGALTARYNVLPRALMNQVNGEDFWGRELEDWDDRVKQALIDLFAPIGAGNLLEVARLQWPPVGQFIPEAEGRIGIVGSFIQISGLNVRAEKTMDMLDNFAKESGLLKADGTPVETWDDLEPHQKKELSKNETLQTELGLRGEAAVERQYPGAEGFAKLDALDQERITRGESLIAELMDDLTAPDIDRAEKFDISRDFRNEVTRLKREIADRKAQVDEDFQLFQETGVLPDDPNQRALTEYYNIFEKAKKPSGVIDWDEVNRLEEELRDKWTPEQESYVDRNIGLTEWGPLLQEFIDAQKTLTDSGYWDADVRDRKVFRFQHPEVEAILTGKFYNQKPIEEGAEAISLEWQDIYRQIDDMETGFKEQSEKAINALAPMEGVTKEDWSKMSADEKRDALIDHEMELIYAENPGFWEDDQRRNAWRKGFVEGDEDTEGFVELYLERAIIVRATSPMSAEAKLFMLDHADFFKRGQDLKIWTDDGSDWNRSVLELQAKHRDAYDLENEYSDKDSPLYIEDAKDRQDKLRQELGERNYQQWVDDKRRIEAHQNDAPEDIVEKWVERGRKIDEFEAGSSEALVWLLDNKDAYDWAIENKLLEDRKAELLEREPILRINVEYATEDDWYNDGIPDKHKGIEDRAERDAAVAKERAEYLAGNLEYNRARYRRDAYGLKDKDFKPFPDELVETYVDYYVLPKKPDDWLEGVAYYEDEWFLQDNPEFHQALVDFGIFKELKDVSESKVPTREIFEKWWVYNTFTTQYDRDAYRLENPDLDEWGVNVAKPPKWTRTMSERRRRARITPSERFLEDVAEASQSLKDIMGRLGEELR